MLPLSIPRAQRATDEAFCLHAHTDISSDPSDSACVCGFDSRLRHNQLHGLSRKSRPTSRGKFRSSCRQGQRNEILQLPVWNALYQVRDFAQYVNWVRAKDRSGRPLPVQELNDSRWRIVTHKAELSLSIRSTSIPSARSARKLNPHHAFFNLAQLLMYPVDARNQPMALRSTSFPRHGTSPHH